MYINTYIEAFSHLQCISRMRGHIVMKLITVTHHHNDTDHGAL